MPFSLAQGAQLVWDEGQCRGGSQAFPTLATHVSPLPDDVWAVKLLLTAAVTRTVPCHLTLGPVTVPLVPLLVGLATCGILRTAGVCAWKIWAALASSWKMVRQAMGQGVQWEGQEFRDIYLGS